MWRYKNCFLFVFAVLLVVPNNATDNYRAVVLIHGVLTGSESMELISDRIKEVNILVYHQKRNYVN